ncbi:helix-turn-helix transcriptional regulator [Lactococcus lactis subsp. lactis]|uniref:helix-turn-helix domain-containing protein n=1 Tax=Lactococcus lactis TaxID=1358 RepID=UPI0024805FE9|nr:helix-turn-helix transcriptional regulator [Lactococcus lactis]MDH8063543.1 helix-turn-helix transcriptional regulator [Lactococcus lactis subsp. lactis]
MFKDNLKLLRKKKALTQKEVAEQLGMTQQNYQKWESGKSSPSGETLERLAEYFGVSIDFLLSGESPEHSVPITRHQARTLRLYGLRKEAKLTIEEVAKKIGVDPELYRAWENGDKAPGPFDTPKISKALGVTTAYLISESNYRTENEKIEAENEKVQKEFIEEIENIDSAKSRNKVKKRLNRLFYSLLLAIEDVGDKEDYKELASYIFEKFDTINENINKK